MATTARLSFAAAAMIAAMLGGAPGPALGQAPERTYEERILRLAEILGAIHHLREICGANEGQLWRERMLELLEVESPPGQLRGRLIAAFNNGFQGYQRTYAACTATAKTATDRFFTEGSQIAATLTTTLEASAEGGDEAGEGAGDGAPGE